MTRMRRTGRLDLELLEREATMVNEAADAEDIGGQKSTLSKGGKEAADTLHVSD